MTSRRQLIFGAFFRTEPAPAEAGATASDFSAASVKPPQIVAIAEHCLAQQNVVCRTCGEHCEAGAIRFSPRLGAAAEPVIIADRCTGCGDCIPVCPNAALGLVNAAIDSRPSSQEFA